MVSDMGAVNVNVNRFFAAIMFGRCLKEIFTNNRALPSLRALSVDGLGGGVLESEKPSVNKEEKMNWYLYHIHFFA